MSSEKKPAAVEVDPRAIIAALAEVRRHFPVYKALGAVDDVLRALEQVEATRNNLEAEVARLTRAFAEAQERHQTTTAANAAALEEQVDRLRTAEARTAAAEDRAQAAEEEAERAIAQAHERADREVRQEDERARGYAMETQRRISVEETAARGRIAKLAQEEQAAAKRLEARRAELVALRESITTG